MADVIESVPANGTMQQTAVELPQELKEQMNLALGIKPEPPAQSSEPGAIDNSGQPPVVQETPFTFDKFKTDYGFEKPEDVYAEITALRELKNNPPAVAAPELKFENDLSKQIFEALREGKLSEVYSSLQQQTMLEKLSSVEVTKDTAADIVKTDMQFKYKDLTPEEINYKFNKQYGVPPKPVQGSDELDEDFEARERSWNEVAQDKLMELLIEAKLAKPNLEAAKSKIIFPNVEQSSDPAYQAYLESQKSIQEMQALKAEAHKEYQTFTADLIKGEKINFKDEDNKIDFDFSFEPVGESFKNSVDLASDESKFFALYENSDGTPNRKQFLSDIYFARNKEAIIRAAIKQGVTAALKANLPDNSGNSGRQPITNAPELTELDKQMQMALQGYLPQR